MPLIANKPKRTPPPLNGETSVTLIYIRAQCLDTHTLHSAIALSFVHSGDLKAETMTLQSQWQPLGYDL